MPAITLHLTEDLAAFLREEAAHAGHADIASFLQSLALDCHEARMAHMQALVEAEGAGSIEALREATRRRYREGGA